MSAAGRRILVVEDDVDMRETLLEALSAAGYAVTVARDGREALEKLAAGPAPSLILADLMMPVMTGWELDAALAADPALASIPVIFASAAGSPPDPRPPRASAYLRKPVQLQELVATIERLCA